MRKLFKYLSLVSVGAIVLYIAPLFFGLPDWKMGNVFPEVISDEDYRSSLIRTVGFASLSTLAVLFLSFMGGYGLRRLGGKKSLLAGSALLLPFLLGSVSTSFLFKMLLFDTKLLHQAFNDTTTLFGILATIQFWQFGTLFVYIFWLNNLSIREDLMDYSNYYQLSTWEKVKNIFLPYHRNLIVLLSIFFFASNVYESAKLQIIFRASKGTNSELISNTLYKAYLSDSKISPDFAANTLFSQSALFYLPVFVVLTVLLYALLNFLISFISKSKASVPGFFKSSEKTKEFGATLLLLLLTLLVVAPIVYVFLRQGVKINNLGYLVRTIGLSFAASVTLLAVLVLPLSYYLRITWKNVFYEISGKNLWIFIALFLLFLVPPLALMLFGFEWGSMLGARGALPTNISWIVGQCVSSLPVIASFIFVVHFFTKNKELEYLEIMKANFSETVKWCFVKRFRVEYIMTFLFAFSIIWNEGTFNKVYSDRIPSYVSEILRTVNSRNADYGQGMMFFLFSLLLGVACIALWNVIVGRLANIKQYS